MSDLLTFQDILDNVNGDLLHTICGRVHIVFRNTQGRYAWKSPCHGYVVTENAVARELRMDANECHKFFDWMIKHGHVLLVSKERYIELM